MLSLCAGCGASYGALPPAALPSSRKLLAAAYFACGPALTRVALVLCARTGDERTLSFEMLYGGLPFAATFLAAQAVSYSSLGQDAPPSPPALQSTPATPPLPLLSPRSRSLSARLGALAPVQFSLALAVVFAAHMLRGPSSAPGGIHTSLGAAGFAVLALANLAQASPRSVARAMALLIMCCPTLRLVSVLVRSPEGMARDLDKFAGAGRCLLTFCAACGAAFGALPPSALPPTRKLLAVGYCACVQMCVGFILRVRTGDERAISFYLLLVLLPFLASFFAAQRGTRPHRPTAAVQLEMGCPLSTPPLKIAVGVCCGLMGGPASCAPSPSPSSVLEVVYR